MPIFSKIDFCSLPADNIMRILRIIDPSLYGKIDAIGKTNGEKLYELMKCDVALFVKILKYVQR